MKYILTILLLILIETTFCQSVVSVSGDITAYSHRFGRGGGASITNLAAGTLTLNVNTTGYSNTATGSAALQYNTTGYLNTATGNGALNHNITGIENSSFGALSLSASTGSYNTATGAMALNANTTGYANTAIGAHSLWVNNGIKNTAIGAGAMENNTTAGFCSALGEDALLHNTIGDGNIGIGWLGYGLNDSGSYNMGIGWRSGNNMKGGHYNVVIGTSAGYLNYSSVNVQKIDATNCIIIGTNSWTTRNNETSLGNDSTGHVTIRGIPPGDAPMILIYDPATDDVYYMDISAISKIVKEATQLLTDIKKIKDEKIYTVRP